jgi:hypothetical protein
MMTEKSPRACGQKYLNAFQKFHANHNPPAGLHGILDRLQKVRRVGADSFTAICPAHDDKSPSLGIKDAGDRVLIHCFSGCDTADVMAAIGLRLSDLFSEKLPPAMRREMALRASRRDLEAALDYELLILAMTLGRRVLDRKLPKEKMPEGWAAMPSEQWAREIRAARRIVTLIRQVYPEVAQ